MYHQTILTMFPFPSPPATPLQATPEICQIRKLNRRLYVKPPTPPPVQPPKPKVDQALASNLRSNHARSTREPGWDGMGGMMC